MRIIPLVALALAGCQSRLTGNEGNFTFSYWTDDDVVDFNKPIAVGASLDIGVADVDAGLPVTLTSAASDDAALVVSTFAESTVTVTGAADGGALLSVAGTTAGGEALTDSINLLAATPDVLRLSHGCDATQAAYLAGQRVWLPFELERENGQSVIGYGYYPLTVDGTAVTLDTAESNETWLALDTVSVGTATLRSDVDDTTLDLPVVEPGSIDGVAEPIAFVLEDIDVGDTNAFYALPSVAGVSVCQADVEKTVRSDTPDICDVRDSDAADANLHEYGWFEIEGRAQGTCSYTVTFPDGNGGAGASAQFSYAIEP
jgi:hypothetical protein